MAAQKSYKPLTEDVVELPTDALDLRSDDEIIAELKTFRPVQGERNLWAFWDSGFDNLHPWLKRNAIGWVRRLGHRWDVRCVDMVEGSPNNVTRYVEKELLADCLAQGTMDGPWKGTHASDLARLPLIYKHGGMWLDIASMILCDLDSAMWNTLEDPASPYEVLLFHLPARHFNGGVLTSCLAARKANPLIERWMTVFNEMWKGRTNADGLYQHPLITHLDPLSPITYIDVGLAPVDGELPPAFMSYFGVNFAYERVRLLHDATDGWNGLEYLEKHVLLSEAVEELWKSYLTVPAEKHFELLSLPFEAANEDDARQVQVRHWVQILTSSCFAAKFSSSYWQPGMPVPLPKRWQEPENMDADVAPGTWAEYLRYASEHFSQRRFDKEALRPVKYVDGEFGRVFQGKLLEPIQAPGV